MNTTCCWLNSKENIALSDMFLKSDSNAKIGALVLEQVKKNWNKKKQGYRKGVYLVPVNPRLFKGNIVQLSDGDYLFGQFEKRIPTEQPRKKISALVNKNNLMPIRGVDVVVYSKAVLAEGKENSSAFTDYEILIVLKKVVKGNQPMPPDTMMYNFFKANGGTDMKCSDKQFIDQLKESFEFWKDKAIIN